VAALAEQETLGLTQLELSLKVVVHLVHQGIVKITLFFCAGNYAEAGHP